MMNGRVLLAAMSLAGAAVLVAQLMAGADREAGAVPVASGAEDGVAGGCTPLTTKPPPFAIQVKSSRLRRLSLTHMTSIRVIPAMKANAM